MASKRSDGPAPHSPMPSGNKPEYDLLLEKGLPADEMAERFCIASVLIEPARWSEVSSILSGEDFHLEKHRRIFARISDLVERGEQVNRATLGSELQRQGQLESVGGFTYLVDLDKDIPALVNLPSFIRLVKEKSALRKIIFNAQKTINRALIGQDSVEELLADSTSQLQEITGGHIAEDDKGSTPLEIIENFPGKLSAFLDPTTRRTGLPSGLTKLDEMTGGFRGGELIVIAARPSVGKSSLMMNIAEHNVLNRRLRKSAAVWTLEMSDESLLTRTICSQARVPHHKFRAGFLNAEERRRIQIALAEITESRLRIYDTPGVNVNQIGSKVRRLVRDEGLHIAFVDYLQLISYAGRSENKNQEISYIGRQLKLLALECDIPVVLLSQLSRATERRGGDMRPMLSDLRDSGTIEENADLVLFLFRPDMYKKDREDLRGRAEVIIGKSRSGPIGTIHCRFRGDLTRFENAVQDIEPGGVDSES